MKLTFTPQRADTRLCLERLGDVLIVNGAPFDFSSVPEGRVATVGCVGCLAGL